MSFTGPVTKTGPLEIELEEVRSGESNGTNASYLVTRTGRRERRIILITIRSRPRLKIRIDFRLVRIVP